MCGIIGIYHKNTRIVEEPLLKKMVDAIHHRGPNDEGCYIHQNIGFYHKRLSIIDLQTDHQPMSDGALTIVFNGEIYNYLELKQKLIQQGHQFKSHSDTEVILKAYQAYGEKAVEKLNGMFAFLIHDQQNQGLMAAPGSFQCALV